MKYTTSTITALSLIIIDTQASPLNKYTRYSPPFVDITSTSEAPAYTSSEAYFTMSSEAPTYMSSEVFLPVSSEIPVTLSPRDTEFNGTDVRNTTDDTPFFNVKPPVALTTVATEAAPSIPAIRALPSSAHHRRKASVSA